MEKKVWFVAVVSLLPLVLNARDLKFSFDKETDLWKVCEGKCAITTGGGVNGNAVRLSPNTIMANEIQLLPNSVYRLEAFLKTESGADNMSVQITGLGSHNISLSSAKAGWTKVADTFNVPDGVVNARLEIIYNCNATDNYAYADEVELVRIGDFYEKKIKGLPPRPVREIKTDMGIAMQPDEKIKWMLDGKLGMFIHWGLYAGPGKGEWYMENNGVPIDEYRKLAYPESGEEYFDASGFNARKLIDLAKKVGMKYCCLTTQHHDGYALFESGYMNAFCSKGTHNRDFVKEYVEACREAGLKVGLYKTLINWRYPGYYDVTGKDCNTDNRFGYVTESWHKENARIMKEELYCQVKELMTNYGKIDHLFWDGGWLAQRGTDAEAAYFWESGKYMDLSNEWPVNPLFRVAEDSVGKPLGVMGMVRKFQPDIVANPRSGWIGDFTCEEGNGPVKGPIRSGVVEKCSTLAAGWGYNKQMEDPAKIVPLNKVKRLFADCIVRNMCFLLNIGPDRYGNVPPLIEQRLLEFGEWINACKNAVYGTRGGPWQPVDGKYGFCYRDNMIYIYFLGDYLDDEFTMEYLDKGMKVKRVYNLIDNRKVAFRQKGQSVRLRGIRPVANDITIIAVELDRPLYSGKR